MTTWIRLWFLTVTLCVGATAVQAQGPAQNLFDARRKGLVELGAIAMHGYSKIEIVVRNLTDRSLRLDPAGSVLTPPDPALQRLGLAGVVGGIPGEDSSLILIGPKGTWKGEVHSVCLDFGKGTPPNGVPYVLSPRPAAEKALRVLRYWAANPHIRQATVNDVVWTGQDLKALKSQVIPARVLDSRLVAAGGALYWLSGHRTLYAVSRDGTSWSRLGESLDTVVAGGGQLAGYIERIPGLRWYNVSQRRWEYFFLPSAPKKVLLGPDRVIYVVSKEALFVYRPGQKQFNRLPSPAVLDAALSPAAVSPVLWVLSVDGRIHYRDREDWKVLPGRGGDRIGATETALYTSTSKGVLRYARKKWTRIGDPGSEFRAGRRGCFLFHKGRVTVLTDLDGTAPKRTTPPKGVLHFCIDRYTDKLWALDEGGRIHGLNAKGSWDVFVTVPPKGGRSK
jgi:hypothetical protein